MPFEFSVAKYLEGEAAFARGIPLKVIIEQVQRDQAAIPSEAESEAATAGFLLGYAGAALQCLYRTEGLLRNLKLPAAPESGT